jgi:hypothetical protein
LPRSTRARAGGLPTTGRLGGAAAHGEIAQVKANHAVVGVKRDPFQVLHAPGGGPFVAAAAG